MFSRENCKNFENIYFAERLQNLQTTVTENILRRAIEFQLLKVFVV